MKCLHMYGVSQNCQVMITQPKTQDLALGVIQNMATEKQREHKAHRYSSCYATV